MGRRPHGNSDSQRPRRRPPPDCFHVSAGRPELQPLWGMPVLPARLSEAFRANHRHRSDALGAREEHAAYLRHDGPQYWRADFGPHTREFPIRNKACHLQRAIRVGLVDGHVFRTNRLGSETRLKRIGEIENAFKPSCSDARYAAPTRFGEVCLRGPTRSRTSQRPLRGDVTARACLGVSHIVVRKVAHATHFTAYLTTTGELDELKWPNNNDGFIYIRAVKSASARSTAIGSSSLKTAATGGSVQIDRIIAEHHSSSLSQTDHCTTSSTCGRSYS